MKSTVEVLREARALYEANPSHAPACESPAPGSHCPITAVVQVELNDDKPYQRAELALVDAIGGGSLPQWNATHSTEEVLAAFDRAIEAELAVTA